MHKTQKVTGVPHGFGPLFRDFRAFLDYHMGGDAMNTLRRWTGCILASIALGGCLLGWMEEGESVGELGNAEFAWDEGVLGCLFGCDAAEPMATRAVAMLVVVNSDELPEFTVSSTDPEVVEFFDEGGGSIRAESHVDGDAKVVLTRVDSGDVLDRFRIRVRDVSKIRTSDPDLYSERLLIMEGGQRTVYIDIEDRRDRMLVGVGAVDYTLRGGITEEHVSLVDAFSDFLVSILVGTNHEYVTVEALAAGAGSLDVRAPSGASLVIPAEVVDELAITRVELELENEAVVGESAHVRALSWAGEERVYSPECAWSLDPADGPVSVESEGRDSLVLSSGVPASATVTCTVGGASDSLTVRFR